MEMESITRDEEASCDPSNASTRVVCLPYRELVDDSKDLTDDIERAFGLHGLGVLTVSGVPGFVELRQKLLPLAEKVANLSQHAKLALEDPASCYNNGWSHGKETLQNGKRDTHKGSFYANPAHNDVEESPALRQTFPEFYTSNMWPEEVPELQEAFMQLGQLIMDVGSRIAALCDRYVARRRSQQQQEHAASLAQVLLSSRCPKGRLLHYFPLTEADLAAGAQDNPDQWCGWHKDHGSLTGLTSAMYLKGGQQVAKPDSESGLYIASRSGTVVKVSIPDDHIAYQVGEAMQIQSGGLLCATPHCVRGPRTPTLGTSRNTLAIFMQPDPLFPLHAPAGTSARDVGVEGFQQDMTFAEFSQLRNSKYYANTSPCKQQAGSSNSTPSRLGMHSSPARCVAPV